MGSCLIRIAIFLFLTGCCDMPSSYIPNPANNPATITLPTPGDLVAAGVADQAWKDIADKDARKVEGAVAGQTGHIAGSVTVDGGGQIAIDSGGGFGVASGGSFQIDNGATCNLNGVTNVNNNALECNAGLDVFGGANIDALIVGTTSQFTGNDTHQGRIKFSGVGRLETNTYFGTGTNADQDITMAMGVQHIQASGLSATRTYVMKNTGCNGRETISIFNESYATHPLNIYQHDGTTFIIGLDIGGDYIGVELWNDGLGNAASSWHIKGATHKP